jgi:Flp pilus assembly protein TadG
MLAVLQKSLLPAARSRRFHLFRRFTRNNKGATAVEFSLVALPFLGMMFAIAETGLVFFAGQTLETAAADSARKIFTGQADGWSSDKFKEEVCSHVYGLFDCNKIQVNVKAYPSFSAADMKTPIDKDGNIVSEFNAGGPGDVVIARLMYEWPVVVPLLKLDNRPGSKRLLMATVAFRNEPYK